MKTKVGRKWGNVKHGSLAFNQTAQGNKTCTAAYALIEDIFTVAGMEEDAKKLCKPLGNGGLYYSSRENSHLFYDDVHYPES